MYADTNCAFILKGNKIIWNAPGNSNEAEYLDPNKSESWAVQYWEDGDKSSFIFNGEKEIILNVNNNPKKFQCYLFYNNFWNVPTLEENCCIKEEFYIEKKSGILVKKDIYQLDGKRDTTGTLKYSLQLTNIKKIKGRPDFKEISKYCMEGARGETK